MVFEAFTKVFETETMGKETNTKVSKAETIVLATGTMVFLIKKIVCFTKTIVFGIGTMVWVKNTTVPTSETTVMAAKKMVSIAPTMVLKLLSIVFVTVEQSFANSMLVFLELRPARIINNSRNSPSNPTDQPQLHRACASHFLSSFILFIRFLLSIKIPNPNNWQILQKSGTLLLQSSHFGD
jgi:hypothetical protein